MAPRTLVFLALLGTFAAPISARPAPARAQAATSPAFAGRFESALGRVEVAVDGATVIGTLLEPARECPFRAGEEVLRGTVLDDSVAGKIRVWLRGDGCKEREAWGNAVLLAGAAGLAGAVHVEAPGCRTPLGPRGGLSLARLVPGAQRPRPAGPEPARTKREKARAAIRDGAAYLGEGGFEAARKRFLDALALDPRVPEAMNGVGVTYRMRNDLPAALDWYKKALAVDPDFGDAYYNMACVYALQGEKALALRFLQIAALNGYASAEGIDADPDLASLHGEPAYQSLVKARL
jgi:tetratricopeptide (TPR) repeat protein